MLINVNINKEMLEVLIKGRKKGVSRTVVLEGSL